MNNPEELPDRHDLLPRPVLECVLQNLRQAVLSRFDEARIVLGNDLGCISDKLGNIRERHALF